jgi:GT2 family glycosyltransferase
MTYPSISVIIVSWHSSTYIKALLESISFSGYSPSKIIIVNNAGIISSEVISLLESFNHLILTPIRNIGFAAACNMAAEQAESHYLLFLNPDIIIHSDTFDLFNEFLNKPPNDLGVCGIGLQNLQKNLNQHCCRKPTFFTLLADFLFISYLFPSLGSSYQIPYLYHPVRVDHVIGAFYCIKKSLFEDVGGFDERFFVYLEDLDLSIRLIDKGYSNYYLPFINATHLVNSTRQTSPMFTTHLSLNSKRFFLQKHFPVLQRFLLYSAFFTVYYPLKFLRAMSHHQFCLNHLNEI